MCSTTPNCCHATLLSCRHFSTKFCTCRRLRNTCDDFHPTAFVDSRPPVVQRRMLSTACGVLVLQSLQGTLLTAAVEHHPLIMASSSALPDVATRSLNADTSLLLANARQVQSFIFLSTFEVLADCSVAAYAAQQPMFASQTLIARDLFVPQHSFVHAGGEKTTGLPSPQAFKVSRDHCTRVSHTGDSILTEFLG